MINKSIENMGDDPSPGLSPLEEKEKKADAPKTILVVEDEYHIQNILRLNLEMEGYRVFTAGDGQSALELISREKPDLIITDIMMPEMDGLEMFLNLKEKEDTRGIPVIVITVKSQIEDKKSASILGVDEYITKPFDPEYLNKKVRELLKKR